MKTAIIDYDAGNLANVVRAAERAGLSVEVTRNPEVIRSAKSLILPGVGAMKDAMEHLDGYGLSGLIREEVKNGKKLAGICLGMQALYEVSEENGHIPALGLLPGRIVHFPEGKLKVPHMGWNIVKSNKPNEKFSENFTEDYRFYFVHSYYAVCENESNVLLTCDYGKEFTAAVQQDHIYGVQFHPEKSHKFGMQLLKNFSEIQ